MTYPTLHLNGSGKASLQGQYKDAYTAVDQAISVLAQSAPHGRDYYPQGDSVIDQAVKEHRDRMQRLYDVQAELLELFESVDK